MRLHIITSPYYAANSLVIIPQPLEGTAPHAVVVDPSAGILPQLKATLEREGAVLAAVLLTHGHPDHVWDCARVASWGPAEKQVPVWIPGPDRYRLVDPAAYVNNMPARIELDEWVCPDDLRDFPAGSCELIPSLWMKMLPAPGHTEGSALFLAHSDLDVYADGQLIASSELPIPWALSGDVIFSGSVGRTDLPGGDETQMRHSLRTISHAVDPRTLLFPGHGPATTLQAEIDTNPYVTRARRIG
ncbi:MBL fold metallo-hydrolase [Schaalia sp. lx-100]|uniref:MBL fold metallo-hydrolase n=1 Tax=Schaalia sp. lx-100 TaxID=2899081 RepID=UPI001E2CF4B1|nr:MBL fold metallo-hydrolase [Schaalia sp. lx-100]MCD4557390.1 MBL fold metallo-hydrolase [Schaalia sp. lx-100]